MVMSRKKGLRTKLWVIMDVFDNCPCDGNPIVSTCATTDFIQDEQASGCGMVKNVCNFNHFHHKCGLPGMNFILGTNARKNTIHHPCLLYTSDAADEEDS